jgi:predicted AlkP superfamily phosphohydrolase/phosphomutase
MPIRMERTFHARRVGLLTAFAVAVAALTSCHPVETGPPGRVLLVGIDGADSRMIDPLIAEGRLPHLARLRRQGISGPLKSLMPLESPRIWNSIASGKRPEKHGILSFSHAARRGVRHLYLSSDRKVHALWNIVSDAGLSVAVINWWNTFPPEKINGVMVSDHLQNREIRLREDLTQSTETPGGASTFPPTWEERLFTLVRNEHSAVAFDDPFADNDALQFAHWNKDSLSKYFHEDDEILRFALEVEKAENPDVMLVFFPGIDRVSHFLWGMVEPPELYAEKMRPTPAQREAGRAAFERYYEYTDAMLGLLIDRYADEDLVMVVSDHGFEAGNELGFLTGVHKTANAQNGVIFAQGADLDAEAGAAGINVLDITPTILTWLGLPVGKDMDGEVAGFVGGRPTAQIETHDRGVVERLDLSSSGADEKILENLKALGYIKDE